MGAQVIMAVRHDMLHKVTSDVTAALGRMASRNDETPRHFEPVATDAGSYIELGDGRAKQGILCSHHHDMDGDATLLVNGSFLCSMPQLIGLDCSKLNSFADVTRFVAGRIRQRRYPFSNARVKHTLTAGSPSPLLNPSSNMISLFSYYTDSWDWSGARQEKEDTLADLLKFCRTGVANPRTFGFYDREYGYHGNRLRPLATFPDHLLALVSLHLGQVEIGLLPARVMTLEYETLGIELDQRRPMNGMAINAYVFKTLLQSQGQDFQRLPMPGQKPSALDYC